MKKILLVSPFPPSQNPRLVKEYNALKENGYEVKVLYAVRDQWSATHEVNEDFILVGGQHGSFVHLLSRVIHKLSKRLLPYELNYHRASLLLLWKAIRTKANLYIGHDLTALPIVVRAAKKNKSRCGFDAEDFHRNEVTNDVNSFFYKASKVVENKYLPEVDYLTCASPLIAEAYQKLYPQLQPVTVNNVFSKSHIAKERPPRTTDAPLKLFWFSQTVGEGRGLETVIKAISLLQNLAITLTILGEAKEEVKNKFSALASENNLPPNQLIFLEPVTPDQIFEIAASHHIGLALETSIPYNRDICLTNKIFTYLNSGLAIIASETSAQKQLLEEHTDIGLTFKTDDVYQLTQLLKSYYEEAFILDQHRNAAKKLALEKYNWEKESKILLSLVEATIEN